MSLRLQAILLILLILILLVLINQVRIKKVELKYTLAWFGLVVGLILLVCFPNSLAVMADALGITVPINMVFFCGFLFSLVIIYILTVALSRNSDRIRSLAQQIALNEYENKKNSK